MGLQALVGVFYFKSHSVRRRQVLLRAKWCGKVSSSTGP